jgi:hypothetical protein
MARVCPYLTLGGRVTKSSLPERLRGGVLFMRLRLGADVLPSRMESSEWQAGG